MPNRYVWLIILSIFFQGSSHAGVNNYTWKDDRGTLNITDYPPPEGVEILEISPVPQQQVEQAAPPVESPRQVTDPKSKRRMLEEQAERYRTKEAAARQKAADLMEEAGQLRSRSAIRKVKRKYRRWAAVMEQEARQLVNKAETQANQAKELEKEAAAVQ